MILILFNGFFIAAASSSEQIFLRPSIPRFSAIFSKYFLEISTSLLSSETALLFSAKVILSSFDVLSVTEGCTVFHKKIVFGDVFYIEVFVKLLFSLF